MTISEFVREIRRRNGLLYRVGMVHAISALLLLVLLLVDHRTVMGINAWIKPLKFAVSITIYLWTFAWLLEYLPNPKHAKWISWTIAISMIVEMALITMQAGRGTQSHFNVTNAMDGAIFGIMGIFIAINTLANLVTLVLFFSPYIKLEKSFQIAWQFGLLMLFLGSISGGLMVGRLAHTVGAVDGGPGLPLVNWSTIAGDIRAPHFFTLHGLQLIPILWWFVSVKWKLAQSAGVLIIISLIYLLACIGLHVVALEGMPILKV